MGLGCHRVEGSVQTIGNVRAFKGRTDGLLLSKAWPQGSPVKRWNHRHDHEPMTPSIRPNGDLY